MKKLAKKTKEKRSNVVAKIILFVIAFLIFLLRFTTIWTFKTYGSLKVEELVFHLKVPLNGVEAGLFNSYIVIALIPTLVTTVVVCFLILLIFTNFSSKQVCLKWGIRNKSKIHSIRILPHEGMLKYVNVFLLFLLFFEVYTDMKQLNITEYLENQSKDSPFIEENYVSSMDITYTFPENKKNLIYIMVESFESTYFSIDLGGAQEENLLEELIPLIDEGTHFSNTDRYGGAINTPGAGWTAAAMVSQTSGLPLKIPVNGNSYGKNSAFLSGVYSLGDILKDNGYKNYIMMGSDSSFAGRDLYYTQHGNYEIYDYYTAIKEKKIPSDYFVWWGFEDSKLYTYAKEKLLSISKNNEPFNFTLLTADTHHIDGYTDSMCEIKYDSNYANSISCASMQLFNFIEWLKKQDFYSDTVVVVAGDHLSMDPNFFTNISGYERTVFDLILNSDRESENTKDRLFSTMDLFPTTLYALDVSISSNRIGLGTNLYSGDKTIFEEYGVDYVNNELNIRSKFYDDVFLYNKK